MTRIPFGVPFMTQLGLLGGRGLAVGSGRARRDAVYIQARPGAANFRVVGPREFAAAHASGYLPQLGVRAPDGAVREPVTFAANLEGPAAIESGVNVEEQNVELGDRLYRADPVQNLAGIGMNAIENANYGGGSLPDLGDVSEELNRIQFYGPGSVRYTVHDQSHN